MTNMEFLEMSNKSFKFGLYKVILKTNHALFNYKIGKSLWLTHHDMKIAKMLKLEYSIDEDCINALIYDFKKCVNGYTAFKDYFDKCFEWLDKATPEQKKPMKNICNALWGAMCSKKKVMKRATTEEKIDLDDYHLDHIEFYPTTTVVKVVEKKNVFKYSWARVCFITAFGRYQMVKTLLECGADLDYLVYANTDGFISTKKQNLPVSDKIGEWSEEFHEKCEIKNGNTVIF